jgi:type IX secretion system PorP/SprF family membrane protein
MKRTALLFLGLLLSLFGKAQQDSQFTQYVFNGIHINPGYAGSKEELYVQSFYRAQWQGLEGAPTTFSVSADVALMNNNVGLGLIVSSDQIGAQRNLSAYVNYAYRLRVGFEESTRLSFGIAGGIVQTGLDGGKLNALRPGDIAVPTGMQSLLVPDARIGVYYADTTFFAGLSLTNIIARSMANKTQENMNVPVLEPHLYFSTGALFRINSDVRFKPVILIKDDFKGPMSIDLNAFFLLKEKVWLGGFYKTEANLYSKKHLQEDLMKRNALGLIAEVFATPDLRVGYSYDYLVNKFRSYNYGSHELSVGFYFSRKTTSKNRGKRCYHF